MECESERNLPFARYLPIENALTHGAKNEGISDEGRPDVTGGSALVA
jgi:hypothetical protein